MDFGSGAPPIRTTPTRLGRLWRGVASLAGLGYLTFCLYLYFEQTDLLYPRTSLAPELARQEAVAAGLEPWIDPGTASLLGYVPTDFKTVQRRGTIVLFHGNGTWAAQRTLFRDALARRGWRVFFYEYVGYGGRPGRPNESVIVPDARRLVRELDRQGFGPIYLWGESLGSGVAAAVAAEPGLPVQGLVLLTPWNTLTAAALTHYPIVPVPLILKERYDSIENLRHFAHPICLVRGSKDQTIPPRLTLDLFAHLSGPKKIILFEGVGHDDWPHTPELTWWDDALDFVAPPAAALPTAR